MRRCGGGLFWCGKDWPRHEQAPRKAADKETRQAAGTEAMNHHHTIDDTITRECAGAQSPIAGKSAEYYAGRDAYLDGEPPVCPYNDPPDRTKWFAGYYEARTRERMKDVFRRLGHPYAAVLLCLLPWLMGASEPGHVRRANNSARWQWASLPAIADPPAPEPLTWQQEWVIQRSILIQTRHRHGHPIDLPE